MHAFPGIWVSVYLAQGWIIVWLETLNHRPTSSSSQLSDRRYAWNLNTEILV